VIPDHHVDSTAHPRGEAALWAELCEAKRDLAAVLVARDRVRPVPTCGGAAVTEFQADILRIVRIFGPMSNADVARRLRSRADVTYPALKDLESLGYVVHPKRQQWDISGVGRRWFRQQPNKPLTLFAEEQP
jgi:hypothetical protein